MDHIDLQVHVTNDPGYMENGFVISRRAGGNCWIIDPGFDPQAEQIAEYIRDRNLRPTAILLTHGHLDHIAGIDALRESFGHVPVYLAQEEWAALRDPTVNLSAHFGIGVVLDVHDPIDLVPGETLELEDSVWQILDTSGHSPGGRSFYCAEAAVVIVGDALFAGSIGRVDFPNSSGDQLLRNIRNQLMTLPDDVRALCGHGPTTTIGTEKMSNPYVLHGL
jgi:hydroxyacylglutathione hydrolase